jgi:putative nucleotidyltransferase with HDIG domain
MYSAAHVLPSVAVMSIGDLRSWWVLPIRTIVYAVVALGLNYIITAVSMAFVLRVSFWQTLFENVGFQTIAATLALGFSGGILFLLLKTPGGVGYVMAPILFGFVVAVRSNVSDARRQAELKDQTLDLAAQVLDARDRYTESHSIRVADLAGRLGHHLELGDLECELIRMAGSLHDLGKIGVRDDILNKPGPLTEEEWEIMRRHPDIGADMIEQHSALAEVAPLVRHHHERWDGTGYPSGFKGDVIPFGARILSVADSFDTITGPRLYRRSLMTPIEGVEDISRRASRWYDPNVVDALRELHGLKALELLDRPPVPRRITSIGVLRSNPSFSNLVSAIAISSLGDPLTQVATLVTIFVATNHDARAVALGFITQAVSTILMSSVLGGLADKLSRRTLVVTLELTRAAILVGAALLVAAPGALANGRWWLILPILFALAAINAVVQPARQAAIPGLVPLGQAGKANAIVAATGMLAGAFGFALAGTILASFPKEPWILFVVDAMTFALGALIVLGIRNLGGGAATAPLSGALKRTWSIAGVRPHLVVGTLAALLIPMSLPALLALAYRLSPADGGTTYSLLEVVLSVGIFAGSIVVGRFSAIGSMRTVGAGLLLTGVFSLAIAMSPPILIAVALFVASVGNPIYAVANQTALLEAADASNRGTVMATRFGLVQTASIVGTAVGGVVTSAFGPFAAYGVLGVGIILLAMYALSAGRSTTNVLHGAAYEDAQLEAAVAPTRVK